MVKSPSSSTVPPETLRGPVSAQDLAELVSGMSRFLTMLVAVPPFADARIGLAEWSVLNIVAKTPMIGQKQVAGALGITGQRVSQIIESLLRNGLVSVTASEKDSRSKVVGITDAGAAKLSEVNAALEVMLAGPLKNKERVLASASRVVNRHLLRALRQPRTATEIAAIRDIQNKKAQA